MIISYIFSDFATEPKFKYEGKLQNMLPTFHDLFYGFITFDILTFLLLIFITIDWYLRKKK